MKKWWQKTLVIAVALLTFGLITPNHEIWDVLENGQASNNAQNNIQNNNVEEQQQLTVVEQEESLHNVITESSTIDTILSAAKEQSYKKFGTRIAPVIGDEFEERIFPKLEEAIELTLARLNDQSLNYLTISGKPSGEYGEKIFHIADGNSGKDLIRFHVRTEKRPQDGYFYNFHYHTVEDDFLAHHTIGEIHWSKNTPPKWLS